MKLNTETEELSLCKLWDTNLYKSKYEKKSDHSKEMLVTHPISNRYYFELNNTKQV